MIVPIILYLLMISSTHHPDHCLLSPSPTDVDPEGGRGVCQGAEEESEGETRQEDQEEQGEEAAEGRGGDGGQDEGGARTGGPART